MSKHENDEVTVALRPHGRGKGVTRSVKMQGVAEWSIREREFLALMGNIGNMRRVRLQYDGKTLVEFEAVLDKDCRTLRTAAKVCEPLLSAPLFGKNIAYTSEFGTKRYTKKEVAKIIRNAKAKRRNVTPDTVVKCPECGAEFRVGKQLG